MSGKIENNDKILEEVLKSMKLDECYRITFNYKQKINGIIPMIGFVVKIIKNSNDQIGFEIIYQSENYGLDLVNFNYERMSLERVEKSQGNSLDILRIYIKNASESNWFVEIKKTINESFTMSRIVYNTCPSII